MNLFIFCICAVYLAALGFFLTMSFPRLWCWTYAFKKQERLQNPRFNKLAVIIPARNESTAVGTLFSCLDAQSYPKEHFDVHVIVADPEDPTLALTKKYGYVTYVATEQTCKSDALDTCFSEILAKDAYAYDAYIILDADCALDSRFLEEINNALSSGADIICSKKLVKNYFYSQGKKCSISAACNGTIWTLLDNMGNKYKSAKGYPCFPVGTGLMLSADLIRSKNGWHYKQTLTEDVELMHDAVLDGRRFFYYEHAVIYMEEAQKLSVTNKRRRRWMTGVADGERIFGKRVAKNCDFEQRYYSSALNHIYAYIGTSVVFFAVCAVLALTLGIAGVPQWTAFALLATAAVGVVYLSFFIMSAVVLACEKDGIPLPLCRKIALLFINPFFYMLYIPIVTRALFFRPKNHTWEAIQRVDFSDSNSQQGD